jgi:hypothetical protein
VTKDRGFNKLKGVTIKAVSASCVNHTMLLSEDGWIFMIDAEIENGIPVMKVTRYKETFVPRPEPVRLKPKGTK